MEQIGGCSIYLGDCLDVLPTIESNSVDMVLTDLPYEVLNKGNKNASWDKQIPLDQLWEQLLRVSKENAAIVLFAQGMFTAKLMMSQPKRWRYNLIWDKVGKTGFLNAKRAPLRRHEDILVFYGKQPVYNPQMEKCEPHKRNHSKGNMLAPQKNSCYGPFKETPTIVTDEKFPSSIISIPKEHKNGSFYHPTQKSVKLLEYLINTYSNRGGVILDATMGSGSTLLACMNTGRVGIGIEKEEKYYEIARERLHGNLRQLNLFD